MPDEVLIWAKGARSEAMLRKPESARVVAGWAANRKQRSKKLAAADSDASLLPSLLLLLHLDLVDLYAPEES